MTIHLITKLVTKLEPLTRVHGRNFLVRSGARRQIYRLDVEVDCVEHKRDEHKRVQSALCARFGLRPNVLFNAAFHDSLT